MRAISFFLISGLLLCNCTQEKEQRGISYHKNGRLKHEVMLINGKPEGLGIVYFENGKTQSKTYWKEGKKHGKSIIYYENGNIRQENEYEEGISLSSKDYTEDGYFRQLTVYDSLGRISDYYCYDKSGARNFSKETKKPIFITVNDTINLGDSYTADIRLGNRQFASVEVFLGKLDRGIIKNNPPLPRKDSLSLTSILIIKPDTVGEIEITGVVFERNEKWDSLDVIPFSHRFYVKPSKNQN
jgi:hypothetical protein